MTNFDETKTIDAETLWNTPIPPVRWVVPDLLPAGLSILAGASKAGKSWLCLWLCLQIARGGQVWGRQVSSQPVLYLCLEDTFNRIQSRLLQIDGEGGSPSLLFQTRSGGIGQGLEAEITTALNHHPGIGLVVIDTLQKVRSVEPSGSAYAADYRDMSALKQLADAHHICILLVHHLRKQGAEDPFAQISGSTGLMGAADTIWLLQRQRMSPTARLQVTGRDVESRALTLEFNDCVWDLLEETTDRQQAERAIPAWLWQAADFLAGQAAWQGTASQLLAAAGIDGVQPNQFTRSLVQHYHQVFAPRGLRFVSKRTANARLLTFTRDDDDGDDGTVVPSPGVGGIPKTPSSSSSPSFWAQDGNKQQALRHSVKKHPEMRVGFEQRPQPQEKPQGQNDQHHPVVAGRHAGSQGFLQRKGTVAYDAGRVKGQKVGRPAHKDQRPHNKQHSAAGRPPLCCAERSPHRKPIQCQKRRVQQNRQRQTGDERVQPPVQIIFFRCAARPDVMHIPAGHDRQRYQHRIDAAPYLRAHRRRMALRPPVTVQRGGGRRHRDDRAAQLQLVVYAPGTGQKHYRCGSRFALCRQ